MTEENRQDMQRRADAAYEKAHRLRTAFRLLGLDKAADDVDVIMEALAEAQSFRSFHDFAQYTETVASVRASRGGA
jgi:hypothetical protein